MGYCERMELESLAWGFGGFWKVCVNDGLSGLVPRVYDMKQLSGQECSSGRAVQTHKNTGERMTSIIYLIKKCDVEPANPADDYCHISVFTQYNGIVRSKYPQLLRENNVMTGSVLHLSA